MTAHALPDAPGIDTAEVEDLYRQLLKALGQDPGSEDLRDTPRRAAAFWAEFLHPGAGSANTMFSFEGSGSDLAAVSGIDAWTVCQSPPPTSPSAGSSACRRFARIDARHAAALQVQEALTHQIAMSLAEATGSPAAGVWVTGEHLCMLMRGTRAAGARARTQTLLGTAAADIAMKHRLHAAAHPGNGALS